MTPAGLRAAICVAPFGATFWAFVIWSIFQ